MDDIAHYIYGSVVSGTSSRSLPVYAPATGELKKRTAGLNCRRGYSRCCCQGRLAYVIHDSGITPFNFPAMVPMWKFPVALACGNTFILKPSERDPSASLKMAEWLTEAGFPNGVFNVVQGDKEAVDALLDHPDVLAISFVGWTPITKYIYSRGISNGKRVQALAGAKNHAIILPAADLDKIANALMGAAFGSAGERCMAISVAVPVKGLKMATTWVALSWTTLHWI